MKFSLAVSVAVMVLVAVTDVTLVRAQSPHPVFSHARRTSHACATDLDHCPAEGCGGGDLLLNTKKNIMTVPTSYEVITFDNFRHLDEESPSTWKQGQPRTEVEELGEGSGVMLTGYLYGAHEGSPETCNCKLSGEDSNDYHLNIIENDEDAQTDSVVVEMTPKFRRNKPDWTLLTLNSLPAAPNKRHPLVRVSGYLLFDSEHVSRSGGERFTIWEIHPITKIENCPTGTCQQDDQGWTEIGAPR
jgi:hypothetical protein